MGLWTQQGRRGGMNWEVRIDRYTPPCVKWAASENLLSSTRSSAWCPVTTYKGGMGLEGTGGKSLREEVYAYSLFTLSTAETNTSL